MTDRFPRVGPLARGYARRQVDAYLARVETALESGRLTSRTTAAAIRKAAFDLVLRGYDPAAVDVALDELEQRAIALEAAERADPAALDYELTAEAGVLRDRATGPYGARFRRTSPLRRGYVMDDVDDLLDSVAASLLGEAGPDAQAVRTSVFRPKRGGYDEDDVDDYLDRVVDLLLRREQLREVDRRWSEPAAETSAQRQGRRPIDGPLFRPPAAARGESSGQGTGGYGTGGYEQPGYDRRGYPIGGYEQPRYEQPSYEQPSYEQPSYEQPSYEQPSYERPGYSTGGSDGQWGDDRRSYGTDWSAGGATR